MSVQKALTVQACITPLPHNILLLWICEGRTDGQSYMRSLEAVCVGAGGARPIPASRVASTQRQSPDEINHAVIWFRPVRRAGAAMGLAGQCRGWADGRLPLRGERDHTEPITCLSLSMTSSYTLRLILPRDDFLRDSDESVHVSFWKSLFTITGSNMIEKWIPTVSKIRTTCTYS